MRLQYPTSGKTIGSAKLVLVQATYRARRNTLKCSPCGNKNNPSVTVQQKTSSPFKGPNDPPPPPTPFCCCCCCNNARVCDFHTLQASNKKYTLTNCLPTACPDSDLGFVTQQLWYQLILLTTEAVCAIACNDRVMLDKTMMKASLLNVGRWDKTVQLVRLLATTGLCYTRQW